MAPSATHRTHGLSQVTRSLRAWRRQLFVGVVAEVVATLVGVPLPCHLVLGVGAHIATALLTRHD